MTIATVIISPDGDMDPIRRAYKSVLTQTHPVDEIVIVAMGIDTVTMVSDMVSDYDGVQRTKVVPYHEHNVNRARNHALSHTDADIICFMGPNDHWTLNSIESRIRLMDDGVCLVAGCHGIEGPDDNLSVFRPIVPDDSRSLGGNTIGSPGFVMLSREAFEKVGGFDTDMRYLSDWDLWINMLGHGKAVTTDELCGMRFYNNFDISSNYDECKIGWSQFLKKHDSDYKRHKEQAESAYAEYSADMERCHRRRTLILGPIGLIRRKVINRLPWIGIWDSFISKLDVLTHPKDTESKTHPSEDEYRRNIENNILKQIEWRAKPPFEREPRP